MSATRVLDDSAAFPALRAVGYDTAGGHFRLSDYGVFELASGARVYSTIRTVGAGGMYSTLRDLGTWTEKLFSGAVIDSALVATAISPIVPAPDERGIDRVLGYGYGWVASRRNSEEVIWHDGGFAGFRTIIARVPRRDVTVIVLSNSALVKQHDVALAVLDELATRNRLQ
jgi:CubicO group peptidase (beta-lactamase class C family)